MICKYAGISRQAYYKSIRKDRDQSELEKEVLEIALPYRCRHSRMSCKKIYSRISPSLKNRGIKFGRDKFIKLMGENGYHVRIKRRYKKTTNSNHNRRVFENLIKNLTIKYTDQVWVSDITYLETAEGTLYLSLVTDYYSRRIMGYALGGDLGSSHSIRALKMAIRESKNGGAEIHHSDRGIQYCSKNYQECMCGKDKKTEISMTKGGSPEENAVAERINGILKQEYGISDKNQSKSQCHKSVKEAIMLYNWDRPHLSLGMKTPIEKYNDCA